ncbi:hypothetical protein VP01_14095g1 [Puccinia sorghi]|uniref:Uncharacterized protein n=1 Tax=Puccinia sorghi TaxID=27349 RepID=A0A0L6VL16_9BASI|nr:hypothetical protein VP01_14095g1 [Puccinia sorghi]
MRFKVFCKGFLLGKDSIYLFPTLHNLPRTGTPLLLSLFLWEFKVIAILEIIVKYNLDPHFQCFWSTPQDNKTFLKFPQNADGIE